MPDENIELGGLAFAFLPRVIQAKTVAMRSISVGPGEPERIIYGDCDGIQPFIEVGYENSDRQPYTGEVQYRIQRGEPDQSVIQMIDGKLHVIVYVTPSQFSVIMNEFMGRPRSRMSMAFALADDRILKFTPHRMTKHSRDPIRITSFEFVTELG
jgi:hypothetical protein